MAGDRAGSCSVVLERPLASPSVRHHDKPGYHLAPVNRVPLLVVIVALALALPASASARSCGGVEIFRSLARITTNTSCLVADGLTGGLERVNIPAHYSWDGWRCHAGEESYGEWVGQSEYEVIVRRVHCWRMRQWVNIAYFLKRPPVAEYEG